MSEKNKEFYSLLSDIKNTLHSTVGGPYILQCTGFGGTGKTTFCRNFFDYLRDNGITAEVFFSSASETLKLNMTPLEKQIKILENYDNQMASITGYADVVLTDRHRIDILAYSQAKGMDTASWPVGYQGHPNKLLHFTHTYDREHPKRRKYVELYPRWSQAHAALLGQLKGSGCVVEIWEGGRVV